MAPDLAASVRARLLQIAKAEKTDFNAVLVRYALERFLYRLGQSAHAQRFVLKGAMLFNLWYAMPHRPTRDVDLLGFGASDLGAIAQAFRDIVTVAAEDGMVFDAASVVVDEIRKNAGYAGARVLVSAELARARCRIQVDIGFGDAVTLELDHQLEAGLLEIARKEQQTPAQIISHLLEQYLSSRQSSELLVTIANDLPSVAAFLGKDPLGIQKEMRDEWR